jgi:hypothetical protein
LRCRTGGDGEEAIRLLPLLGIKADPSVARDDLFFCTTFK